MTFYPTRRGESRPPRVRIERKLFDSVRRLRARHALGHLEHVTELYARLRRLEKAIPPTDEDERLVVEQTTMRPARFDLAIALRHARESAATDEEIGTLLSELHPHDVPAIVALSSVPEGLCRLRFCVETHREGLEYVRSTPDTERWPWLYKRRQAALCRLDVIEGLIEARTAGIEPDDIATVVRELGSGEADLILAVREHEWPRRRFRRVRKAMKIGSKPRARAMLEELGWLEL